MKKLAMIVAFGLTGCDNTLTCNDTETKTKVLAVIDSYLVGKWYDDNKSNFGEREISRISTVTSNEDLGRYTCSAQYSFEYKGDTRRVNFTYELNYLEDKKESEVLVDTGTIISQYVMAHIHSKGR